MRQKIKNDIDYCKYSIKEIKQMILEGKTTNKNVVDFYNNEWWDEEHVLTQKEIIEILNNKSIKKCSKNEEKQVFNFAFGEQFMESTDKGKLKIYKQ